MSSQLTAAAVVPFPSPPVAGKAASDPPLRHDEHPATRLRRHGAAVLSDAELVALLTRSRIRTEVDLRPARALLRDGLAPLLQRVTTGAAGMRRMDAVRLAAAVELARRATTSGFHDRELFDVDVAGPRLVARYALHVQEHLGVICLDTRGRVITEREVFVGTLHMATVSTRDVVRIALGVHARSVVVFHNHPSGSPQPSTDDMSYTRRLSSAAELLDIVLVDHLVLGCHQYVSMKRSGQI